MEQDPQTTPRQAVQETEPRCERFTLARVAPVPVGHEVELVYFDVAGEGLMSAHLRSWPDLPLSRWRPLLLDLTAGVTYADSWHPGTFLGGSGTSRLNVTERRRVRGRVRSCTVVRGDTGSLWSTERQTVLELELLAEPTP